MTRLRYVRYGTTDGIKYMGMHNRSENGPVHGSPRAPTPLILIVMKPKVHDRAHKSPSLVPILSDEFSPRSHTVPLSTSALAYLPIND
jgi:hypothetical protein